MIDFGIVNDAVESTFAEDIDIVWIDVPLRKLSGVYDSRHWVAENEGEIGVSTLITSLSVKDDPLEGPKVGERLSVRDTEYTIKEKRPDSTGWAILELELVTL